MNDQCQVSGCGNDNDLNGLCADHYEAQYEEQFMED